MCLPWMKGADIPVKRSPELRPRVWDALVAAVVVALAIACAAVFWSGGGEGGLTAVISVDGEEQERVDLSALAEPEERVLQAGGYTLHLELTREGACMVSSDCPTQDCVHTGTITRSGQSIVCLPARVSVVLTGGADSGVDAVIG